MVDRHATQRIGARRAVVVSAVDPYPSDAGKKVVLAGLLAHLADRLGADNVHYVLVGKPEEAPETFPVCLHPVARPSTGEQRTAVLTRVGAARSSLQEALLRGPAVAQGVVGLAVAALGGGDHPPARRERGGERRVGRALHPVRVQRDHRLAAAAGVEVGKR